MGQQYEYIQILSLFLNSKFDKQHSFVVDLLIIAEILSDILHDEEASAYQKDMLGLLLILVFLRHEAVLRIFDEEVERLADVVLILIIAGDVGGGFSF